MLFSRFDFGVGYDRDRASPPPWFCLFLASRSPIAGSLSEDRDGNKILKGFTIPWRCSIRQWRTLLVSPEKYVRLTNLKITPKLGILVGVTLLGLSAAGFLAGYLMQQEMMAARIDQVRSVVEMGRSLAMGLQKQVDAGQITKEAALAEFGRRANSMTFD
ncbi:MAG TPA: hypothetical protein VJ226_15035, partial [Bradyrhizobium sp.]|nr:hypothetical protein [Bradyrhizobium sp.]